MRTAPPVLAPLFRSDGQARLLACLLLLDLDELSIADLAQRARLAYGTAHREVERLLESGLLRERRVGNVRLISADPNSPLTAPVRQILQVSAGPVPLLAAELQELEGVDVAFIYGSFAARLRGVAGEPPRDIDVMVIGEPEPMAVYEACARVSDRVGRPVQPTIMSWEEWRDDSGFLQQVRQAPRLLVIGELP